MGKQMTTTLTPYATIQGRLAAAQAERVTPTQLVIEEGEHWSITNHWARVPSSGGDDDYTVFIVDEPGQPIRTSCNCKAGEHGVMCKHVASVLAAFGMISEDFEYETMREEG